MFAHHSFRFSVLVSEIRNVAITLNDTSILLKTSGERNGSMAKTVTVANQRY